jgi:hypothetical protein
MKVLIVRCKCGGLFDEDDLCFECDSPRPKTEAAKDLEREEKEKPCAQNDEHKAVCDHIKYLEAQLEAK